MENKVKDLVNDSFLNIKNHLLLLEIRTGAIRSARFAEEKEVEVQRLKEDISQLVDLVDKSRSNLIFNLTPALKNKESVSVKNYCSLDHYECLTNSLTRVKDVLLAILSINGVTNGVNVIIPEIYIRNILTLIKCASEEARNILLQITKEDDYSYDARI